MQWLSFVSAFVASFVTIQVSGHALDIGVEQVILSPTDSNAISTSQVDAGAHRNEFHSTIIPDPDGELYEQFAHPAFSEYQLRVARPKLCDPTVKQYSGYLDISDTRHLFFWFFEARQNPESAPLMMWLNGGPGCSSTTGMLFENGPCTIVDPNTTVPNPHSWNNIANMVFLDQPVGTGFSYASDGSKVDTLADLAVDVYAFLQLFVSRFPEYSEKPLHLAAESWGGHYGPNIASYVYKMNKQRIYAPFPGQKHINLASLFESIPEYMCDVAPYPPFEQDSAQCKGLRLETPVCTKMIEACYRFPSKATCNPATEYCWLRRNPYDLREECKDKEGVCYVEMNWISNWMNNPRVKHELGVDTAPVPFVHCNMTTNRAFYAQGQAMRNSAALLPPLIKEGMRLLVFAGDTDGVCNYLGVERWMLKLEHKHHEEFTNAPLLPFLTELGDVGGKVRSAGGSGAGNVTFVQIFDGGHMAPHDQPEATLEVITRWVKNVPFDVVG
ncbi:alpha/beta-hydrolase [Lentinus tigrinus ALCF2SS1-6]|uniref:Alpha/beta-hydrolase n=1 Tax=Lentinus tigrinus ALCF2SS1-6 TaxID=1328759 RepID=A0A5C2SNG8_9APHY|nr:alpha/beta-hydrolase [Lentinus tigrinus ALCF2SS1-6]